MAHVNQSRYGTARIGLAVVLALGIAAAVAAQDGISIRRPPIGWSERIPDWALALEARLMSLREDGKPLEALRELDDAEQRYGEAVGR